MDERATIEIHVSFAAKASEARTRGRSGYVLSASTRATVGSVGSGDAPVCAQATWEVEGGRETVRWRAHGGAVWRPVIAADGRPLDGPDGFAAETAAFRNRARGTWHDYPFLYHSPGTGHHRAAPFGMRRSDDPGLVVHSDDRDRAFAAARLMAAEDLLLVDGVLHRRSTPPVWAVGTRSIPESDPGGVRLVIPDYEPEGDWLASFPLDRKEDAVAFARAHVAALESDAWFRRFNGGRAVAVGIEEAQVGHVGQPLPDTRADDFRRAYEACEDDLRNAELRQFSRAFRKAFGDAGALVDEIGRDGVPEGWHERAERTAEAIVAAADPDWPHTWPNAGSALRRFRGIALRDRLEADLAREADMGAFGAFAPR